MTQILLKNDCNVILSIVINRLGSNMFMGNEKDIN